MGFDIEVLPMKDYLPESLGSFSDLPSAVRKKELETLGAVNFWGKCGILCLRENYNDDSTCKG